MWNVAVDIMMLCYVRQSFSRCFLLSTQFNIINHHSLSQPTAYTYHLSPKRTNISAVVITAPITFCRASNVSELHNSSWSHCIAARIHHHGSDISNDTCVPGGASCGHQDNHKQSLLSSQYDCCW